MNDVEKINKWIRDFIELSALLSLKSDYLERLDKLNKRIKKYEKN